MVLDPEVLDQEVWNTRLTMGFPGGSEVKASAWNAGDRGSIPGGNGNPLQYSCLEDPLEKEMATHSSALAWRIPWTEKPGRLQSMGSTESDMTEAT